VLVAYVATAAPFRKTVPLVIAAKETFVPETVAAEGATVIATSGTAVPDKVQTLEAGVTVTEEAPVKLTDTVETLAADKSSPIASPGTKVVKPAADEACVMAQPVAFSVTAVAVSGRTVAVPWVTPEGWKAFLYGAAIAAEIV
jgi:hypothetical protein